MAQTKGIAQAALATPGQINEVVRQLQSAFFSKEKLEELAIRYCSDKDSAQTLIEQAGELKSIRKNFTDLVKNFSNPNLYADQTVNSNYGYLSGYRSARPMGVQIMILRQYDWGRDVDWSLSEVQQELLSKPVLQGSEGYFAVVFDQTMITHYEEDANIDQSGPVTRVLEALLKQRNGSLVNYQTRELDRTHYRRSKNSAEKMKQLWESQGCPTGIFLIPAQLGIELAGKSVLRARVVIRGTEFPLDAYETLQMVLTHPNRIQLYDDLWIDLPGSEYLSSGPNSAFAYILCIESRNKDLWLHRRSRDTASPRHGSASGFLR